MRKNQISRKGQLHHFIICDRTQTKEAGGEPFPPNWAVPLIVYPMTKEREKTYSKPDVSGDTTDKGYNKQQIMERSCSSIKNGKEDSNQMSTNLLQTLKFSLSPSQIRKRRVEDLMAKSFPIFYALHERKKEYDKTIELGTRKECDEFSLLGDEVEIGIRKLPTKFAQNFVKHKIQSTLFKASLGMFDHPIGDQDVNEGDEEFIFIEHPSSSVLREPSYDELYSPQINNELLSINEQPHPTMVQNQPVHQLTIQESTNQIIQQPLPSVGETSALLDHHSLISFIDQQLITSINQQHLPTITDQRTLNTTVQEPATSVITQQQPLPLTSVNDQGLLSSIGQQPITAITGQQHLSVINQNAIPLTYFHENSEIPSEIMQNLNTLSEQKYSGSSGNFVYQF